MLFTVSTVKETVEGLDRFVRRNLAGGVDHLVVFVEDPDPDAAAWLADQPHVTAVVTDDAWWGDRRPRQLNARQKINANLARTALSCVPHAEWVWHLDGDEVLQADRAALARLPEDATVVHAPPLEAVSRPSWPDGRVTWFKKLLNEEDLTLLKVLGVLERPVNEDYFHGHIKGKSGMRPGLDRWFALHEVIDEQEAIIPAYLNDSGQPMSAAEPVATLLHYESWSGEEFVRKWTNILGSGQLPAMRGKRQATAVALRALGNHGLTEPALAQMLGRIYHRTTEDDLDTLRDLGMVTHLDPDVGTHRPELLTNDVHNRLDGLIRVFAGLDKQPLRAPDAAPAAGELLAQAARRLTSVGFARGDASAVGTVWSGVAVARASPALESVSRSEHTRGWPFHRGGT